MPEICDFKAIQPFSFDQGMKGFDAGIVIRITLYGCSCAACLLQLFDVRWKHIGCSDHYNRNILSIRKNCVDSMFKSIGDVLPTSEI